MASLRAPGLGAPAPGASWWEQIAAQLNLLPGLGAVTGAGAGMVAPGMRSAPGLSGWLSGGLESLVAKNPTTENSIAQYLMALQKYRDTVNATAASVRGTEAASRAALAETQRILPSAGGGVGAMAGLVGLGGYGEAEASPGPYAGGFLPWQESIGWPDPLGPEPAWYGTHQRGREAAEEWRRQMPYGWGQTAQPMMPSFESGYDPSVEAWQWQMPQTTPDYSGMDWMAAPQEWQPEYDQGWF